MTGHNAITHAPELLQSYPRAVGLSALEPGVERLGETLTPTLDVWGGHHRDLSFLRRERRCAGVEASVAGAGTFASVSFINPAGSGLIASIDAINFSTNIAGVVTLRLHSPVAGGPAANQVAAVDQRWGTTPLPICVMRQAALGAVPTGRIVWELELPLALMVSIPPQFLPILSPDGVPSGSFNVYHNTATTPTLRVAIAWHERVARPGELVL